MRTPWHTVFRQLLSRLFVVLCLGIPTVGHTSTILETPFEEVVTASQIIFQGQVLSKEVRRLPHGQPMTFLIFRIDELIKGEYPHPTIELGFLGDGTFKVHGLRMPEVSERGVYFVENSQQLMVNPLYGWHQGHYTIVQDGKGQEQVRAVEADVNVYQTQTQSYDAQQDTTATHTHQQSPPSMQSLSSFKQKVRSILRK